MTQRDAFLGRLFWFAKADPRIMLLTVDMGAPALDPWRAELPDQFINVGIAEQNAIGLAAGMALSGKKVFVYSIVPFLTFRCLEQIRNDLCAMRLPVTLVGVGAGLSYDGVGHTHAGIDDVAVMRCLPSMQIDTASDWVMAARLAGESVRLDHPNYVRLDRSDLACVYATNETFEQGFSVRRAFVDGLIVANGCMVTTALEVSHRLRDDGLRVGVVDAYRLPLPDALAPVLGRAKRIVTLEEHVLPGGLGSAVVELLADAGLSVPVTRLGLDLHGGYGGLQGSREDMRRAFGLDSESVAATVRAN